MQQNGSKYFALRSPQALEIGSVGQNSTFTEHGHVAYQIKWITQIPPPPYDPRGMVSKGQNSIFSEHGHVEYQVKGNHEFRNMVAIILPSISAPSPP